MLELFLSFVLFLGRHNADHILKNTLIRQSYRIAFLAEMNILLIGPLKWILFLLNHAFLGRLH